MAIMAVCSYLAIAGNINNNTRGEYEIMPQQTPVESYGMLQHCLLTGIPVYMQHTSTEFKPTMQGYRQPTLTPQPITEEVTILASVNFAFGNDGIARATVIWCHEDWDNNQIDVVEMSKLYTKSEE